MYTANGKPLLRKIGAICICGLQLVSESGVAHECKAPASCDAILEHYDIELNAPSTKLNTLKLGLSAVTTGVFIYPAGGGT